MGNVTTSTLTIIILLLSFGLLVYIVHPFLLFKFAFNIIFFLLNIIENISKKLLFKKDNRLLLDLKVVMKIHVYIHVMIEMLYKLFLFLYIRYEDIVGKENITTEIEEAQAMALRAISAGRVYHYICEQERIYKDEATGEKKTMSLDDALAVADEKKFTVFHVTSRSARNAAEERDRMTEISTRGKKMVYELRSGSTDFHLLISAIKGWDRLSPPEGLCERCGITHSQDNYLDFETLVNSKANQDKIKAGAFKNEIAIDHIPDFARQEIARFVRSIDNGGVDLGEESNQSIDG